MATLPRSASALLWALQWLLAAAFYLLGLLKATLPIEDLQARLHILPGAQHASPWIFGLLEVAAGMALVIPSATRFVPQLTPLAAMLLGAMSGVGALLGGTAAGLGVPLLDGALALGCLGVAVGRASLLPIAPLLASSAPAEVAPRRGRYGALAVVPSAADEPGAGRAPRPAPVEPSATPQAGGPTWRPPLAPDGADPSPGA